MNESAKVALELHAFTPIAALLCRLGLLAHIQFYEWLHENLKFTDKAAVRPGKLPLRGNSQGSIGEFQNSVGLCFVRTWQCEIFLH